MAEDDVNEDEMIDTVGEIDLGDELDLDDDDFGEKDALDLQFGSRTEVE